MTKPAILFLLASGVVASAADTSQIQMLSSRSRSLADVLGTMAREAVYQRGIEFIVPQIIIGGEWTTTIRLTNKGTTPIPSSDVYFVDNYGDPMSATFRTTDGRVVTDSGFSFRLSNNSVLEGTFQGTSATRFGWAIIDPKACPLESDCTLYGEVSLKNKHSSRPDFESVFPLESPSELQYMLWDHRAGYSTVLYLVNVNTSQDTVSLQFRDDNDILIRNVDLTMRSAEARIVTLHELAPETIGRYGTLIVRARNVEGKLPMIVATALRINPTNSFTPVRTFAPKAPLR
ncbi:MAG: hypothetical protein KIT09_15195 [Bryobacteraceae bacterium]|nr:hypothetical protein [Bryobacteraceae bacterium]